MTVHLGILEGDGIGPEIVPATRQVIEATGIDVHFEDVTIGLDAYEAHGSTIPEGTMARLEACDGWILGPVLTDQYPDDPAARNPSAVFRTGFDLYANVRPVRAFPEIGPPGMDVTIYRQNTEGFYADRNMHAGTGQFMPTEDVALSVRVVTRQECRRIARAAFEFAAAHDQTVTAVHKGNVLTQGDGLFREVCRSVAESYPGVDLESTLVDAFAMELVRDPTAHDVVVTTNMFGDILSDEAAGVVGSLGLAPSLNHGDDHAMAQAAHGAAPDIAGEGIANPVAEMLSAAMLLAWIADDDDAPVAAAGRAIDAAVEETLGAGIRTPDLGGSATTDEFAEAVASRLEDATG
jgi:3-isopropylmalate dehydrogenase